MSKTKTDVVQMALRRIGVAASDTAVSADDADFAGDTLDALFQELQNTQGMTITWALDATPENAFLPLSYLLAAEVAPHFMVQAPERRSTAMGRLRAAIFTDDRDDRRDLDDDGTVTESEIDADKRAQFY